MGKLVLILLTVGAAFALACGGDDDDDTTARATTPVSAGFTGGSEPDGGEEAAAGTHRSSHLPIPVAVTTPDGWLSPDDADLEDLFAIVQTGSPNGYIDFLQPTLVYTYTPGAATDVGEPPVDYVAWFNENPFASVVATQEVTIGGLQGTQLEITNDNESFAIFQLADGSTYDLSYLDHVLANVLDANGEQIIVVCGTAGGQNIAEFETDCNEVLSTVEFGE